jgi:hypothetical protein
MDKDLFVQSYPSLRTKIIPVTYTAGPNGYYVVCLLPFIGICFFAALIWGFPRQESWTYLGLGISILGLILATAYLRKLRLEITNNGISYRSLFRGARYVAYAEISTAVLINPNRVRLESSTVDAPPRITLVITPNPHTGKHSVKIPLSFLQPEAENELFRILEPRLWGNDE